MSLKIYRTADKDLIEGCKSMIAMPNAFFMSIFSGKMYALCCRYIKDKMEAEDVLVTSFTKIFERIDQFKGEGSFEGWIRRIIVNESLSYLRKNKSMYLETDIEAAEREPDYASLENQLEADDLLRMISELPSGYRIVFNMYAIDGYSHKEIADQLGISENTSKSQLSRARVALQKVLMESGAESNTGNYEQQSR